MTHFCPIRDGRMKPSLMGFLLQKEGNTMTDNVYGEAYQIFCQHLQDSVTEEMFEAMVLCAISGRWLVIGTEKVVLPIHIYRLTNPTIGKHQKMIINYNNIRLHEDAYSEKDYIIASKTDENLFYLANRLSAIKRWRVPTCLLPLYDEIQQSYPHPAVYFDHPCENHFLDTAIQQLKVDIEKWTQQRRIWYQQIVDDLQLKLKERYHYVRVEKNPFDKNEYEARFCLDSRKMKTLDVELWEKDSCIVAMSNDASCDIALNNAIDALNAARKIVAFCGCRYPID